jgi:hypothetical protein
MAKPEDIAKLSMSMRTCYGTQWKHDAPEAMQIWSNALASYNGNQIAEALEKCVEHYIDFAPTLPQFLQLLRESRTLIAGSAEADKAKADQILAYAKPQGPHNLNGNPQGITLADSIAVRKPGESVEEYGQRISNAVTAARYPALSVMN